MRLTRLTDWLEARPGIDRVGQPANRAINKVIRAGPVKDILSGTWLGHPAHPVAVMIPIGSWTSATIIDFAAGGRGSVVARRLVGLGVLTALPAAVSGLADWSDTTGAEQRVGVTHAALNSAAIVLYGASWWARRRSGPNGTLLALAGMAVATGAGYLGGHMIYAQGVGVDTNAFHSGPQDWETVVALRDLQDGEGTGVDAGRTRLLVVLQGGRIRVLENRCSHRGGPLSEGTIDGDCVTCPWHASRFHLDTGEVVAGPATVGQAVYQCKVTDAKIQVRGQENRTLRTSPDGPGGPSRV
jgi:nitrite reductase/ring-hydroxylating ferredoxin subunit/uncharacterized membrane protein